MARRNAIEAAKWWGNWLVDPDVLHGNLRILAYLSIETAETSNAATDAYRVA